MISTGKASIIHMQEVVVKRINWCRFIVSLIFPRPLVQKTVRTVIHIIILLFNASVNLIFSFSGGLVNEPCGRCSNDQIVLLRLCTSMMVDGR